MDYCEPWIKAKLKERLEEYKKRYPLFNVERVMKEVLIWPQKAQRFAPYMKDKDIKNINRSHHKSQSIKSLATNEHL